MPKNLRTRFMPLSIRFFAAGEDVDNAGVSGGGAESQSQNPPATDPNENESDGEDWQARFEAQQKVNRDLEKKLKSALSKDDAEALRATIAKFEGKEAEYAATQAQRETEAKALAKANERIVARAVREHAATRLSDPADALKFLDLAQFEVGEDGDVDDAAIKTALDNLAKTKPYLAAQGGNMFVSVTAGREGPGGGKQLTQDDLKSMTPKQINDARIKGQLKNLGY